MHYQFPTDLKISPLECLASDNKTRRVIEAAADWLDDHPDFEPKFAQLFNVVLADNEETKVMTQEVYKMAGIKEDKCNINLPLMDVDFTTYCVAVSAIYKVGWDRYIEALYKKGEHKKGKQES